LRDGDVDLAALDPPARGRSGLGGHGLDPDPAAEARGRSDPADLGAGGPGVPDRVREPPEGAAAARRGPEDLRPRRAFPAGRSRTRDRRGRGRVPGPRGGPETVKFVT